MSANETLDLGELEAEARKLVDGECGRIGSAHREHTAKMARYARKVATLIAAVRDRDAEIARLKDDNEMSGECLDMVREVLVAVLGDDAMKGTAPMFYPEAMRSALLHAAAHEYDDKIAESSRPWVVNRRAQLPALGEALRQTGTEPPTNRGNMKNVLDDIARERERQDAQWGGPTHDDGHTPQEWSVFRRKFEGQVLASIASEHMAVYEPADARNALVKIAALAVAQIEALDRKHPGLGAAR